MSQVHGPALSAADIPGEDHCVHRADLAADKEPGEERVEVVEGVQDRDQAVNHQHAAEEQQRRQRTAHHDHQQGRRTQAEQGRGDRACQCAVQATRAEHRQLHQVPSRTAEQISVHNEAVRTDGVEAFHDADLGDN